MSTYTHQLAEGNVRSGFLSGSAGIEYRAATFTLTTDQIASGNVLEFFRIPGDAVVVDGYLKSDALDTDGSPTLTVEVGHDGDEDVFIDTATHTTETQIVRAGGTVQFAAGLPLLPRDPTDPVTNANDPFSPAEEGTVIKATFSAAAATAAAGDITLVIGYIRTP